MKYSVTVKETIENTMVFLMLVYAGFMVYVAYLGVEFHWGVIWALVIVGSAFVLRSTLPVIVGAFFGASDVWGWHWSLALLFAFSGLIFLIPTFILFVIKGLKH